MAGISRFDQFVPSDFSFSVYTPQEFTPDLSMLDELLGGMQKEYDTGMSTLNKIMPNYWREHPTDSAAAKAYKSKYDGVISEAGDAFANGEISKGRSLMNNALREIEKDQLPGGDFYELERRNKEAAEQDKALKQLYIDKYQSPELYQYARKKMIEGASPFKDDTTGEYGVVGSPTLARHIPHEEVVDQLDKIIDNIEADQVVYGGYRGKNLQGISFKQLLERGEIEKIDYAKVADVLSSAITPEMRASYEQYGLASGMGQGQGRAIATEDEFKKTGSVFAPTMVGNALEALAQSKVYRKQKDKSQVLTDEYAKERALKKAEEDDKSLRGFRTTLYTKGSGMPDLGFKIDKQGNIVTPAVETTASIPKTSVSTVGLGLTSKIAQSLGFGKKGKFMDYVKSEKAKEENPSLTEIYETFKGHLDGLDDKKAYDFISKKYEEKQKKLSMTDDVIYPFDDKEQDYHNQLYIGTSKGKEEGALGLASHMTVTVYEPGQEPKVYSGVEAFLNENGISRGEWTRNANTLGDVRADNPAVIAGIRGIYIDPSKKGKVYDFSLSHKDEQAAREELPLSVLGSPTMDGNLKESPSTTILLPSRDEAGNVSLAPKTVYSKAEDVYLSEELVENIGEYERARATGKPLPFKEEEYKDMKKTWDNLKLNPANDTFSKRRAIIYDVDTNRPLLDANNRPISYEFLLQLNRKMQSNE